VIDAYMLLRQRYAALLGEHSMTKIALLPTIAGALLAVGLSAAPDIRSAGVLAGRPLGFKDFEPSTYIAGLLGSAWSAAGYSLLFAPARPARPSFRKASDLGCNVDLNMCLEMW
jgi:hypothetical protein